MLLGLVRLVGLVVLVGLVGLAELVGLCWVGWAGWAGLVSWAGRAGCAVESGCVCCVSGLGFPCVGWVASVCWVRLVPHATCHTTHHNTTPQPHHVLHATATPHHMPNLFLVSRQNWMRDHFLIWLFVLIQGVGLVRFCVVPTPCSTSGQDLLISVILDLSVVHGSAKAPGSLDHKTKAEANILMVVG